MRIVRPHQRNDVNTRQAIAAGTIVAAVFLGLVVAAFPAPASATEPVAGATAESPPEAQTTAPAPKTPAVAVTESYGWQIVLADLGGLLGTGVVSAAGGEGLVLVAPYFLASPIVHVAHGNTGTGLGALGLHLIAPVGGIMVAAVASNMSGSPSQGEAMVALAWGAMGGMVAATIIDAVFLAHSTVETAPQVALVPTLSLARAGGATVGLAATF